MLTICAFVTDAATEQSSIEKREAAYRANNIGVALLEQYKPKDAAESFERALTIDRNLHLAQINLGIALYYVPDNEGAKRAAEKALTQEPSAPQPHYILGLIARADNRFDDAIKEFQSVLTIDNEDVATNINIGQIYVPEKKYEPAIAAFRKALAAEPYNETALYNLGMVLTRTGAKEEGQRALQKFQRLRESGLPFHAPVFIEGDFFEIDWSYATVVTCFLNASVMRRLLPKFLALKPGTRIVSNTFVMWAVDAIEYAETGTMFHTAMMWRV